MAANSMRHIGNLARGGALLLALLAGCAGPAELAADSGAARGNRNEGRQLYAGQPPVVHATEFPVASAAEGLARGDDAWRAGKLDLAVYLYVQSLAFDADSPQPFLRIAAIHEKLGNDALAEKAFEEALERDPQNAGASERLGLLYLGSGKDGASEKLLHAAVRLDPDRWRSYNGLGILADRRAEYALAEQHYDRAHLLAPGNASVINNRGYSHYLAGRLEAAEADLRYAVQLGAPAGTWTNLGKVEARLGRFDDALASLLKEMDTARAYNVLGEVMRDAGDLERARQYFSDAISAAPRYYQQAHDNLAEVDERIAASRKPAAVVGHADPLKVPVGYWLSQGKARTAVRRQGAGSGGRQAGNRGVKSP